MTTTDQTARDVIAQFIPHLPNEMGRKAIDALADAGYAVVRLPEPVDAAGRFADWTTGASDDLYILSEQGADITLRGTFKSGTATTARRLAAALLAAADHQEKNQ